MGIFAKRNIQKHEELTFNYNVDRYGHQAQTCYCGEPNCVGFIGGKTQTDVVTIDDLYLDGLSLVKSIFTFAYGACLALGLDEEAMAALKGTKKKKGKKIDDPDFMVYFQSTAPKCLNADRTAARSQSPDTHRRSKSLDRNANIRKQENSLQAPHTNQTLHG